MDGLVTALKQREARRTELTARLKAIGAPVVALDRDAVELQVHRKLADWRVLIGRNVQDGRQLFREMLDGPIRCWPMGSQRALSFEGKADLTMLFAGVAGFVAAATEVASPTTPAPFRSGVLSVAIDFTGALHVA